MADIRDILANELHGAKKDGSSAEKTNNTIKRKRKPKNMSREVFSLLGNAVAPLVPAQTTKSNKRKSKKKTSGKWKFASFDNVASRKKTDLTLFHWVRADIEYPEYPFAKFNVKMSPVPTYTDQEYEETIKPMHQSENWSREETDKLFSLCSSYELRWPVIHDRFSISYEDAVKRDRGKASNRTLTELKQRFYDSCKALLQSQKKDHEANEYTYDFEADKTRTEMLDRAYRRTKAEEIEEKRLRAELKEINTELHRLERAVKANTKMKKKFILGTTENVDATSSFAAGPTLWLPSMFVKSRNYLRSARMNARHTVSGPGNRQLKKMDMVIQELGVPNDLMATDAICKTYSKLRKSVLKVLSLQKHLSKMEARMKAGSNSSSGGSTGGSGISVEPAKNRSRKGV